VLVRRWTTRPRAVIGVAVAVAVLLVGSGLVALARTGTPAAAPEPVRHLDAVLTAGVALVAGGVTGRAVTQSPGFQTWLAQGVVPSPDGPYAALATTALSDLYSLTLHNGGVIASTRAAWHYVWPRDSAFAAAALARTGHLADAVRDLRFLQAVQAPDGSFQARYLVDGSGPPDARAVQEDGPGWALWAVDEVIAAAPVEQRPAVAGELQPLVQRSLHRLIDRTDGPGALPPPSSDYWEVSESQLTLGIAAPTLAGLLSGSRLVQSTHPAEAALAVRRATALRASIEQDFGTSGYSRYPGGRGPDSAVTFTLPPYVDAPLSGAVAAAHKAATTLRQPGGGVTPGATWPRRDQLSWTPESALFLLAAATTGDRAGAEYWLAWFARHSAAGTIPEKVDSHGRAAPVAPLAWTDALVLLALDQLDLIAPKS
jgi:glucoamylase